MPIVRPKSQHAILPSLSKPLQVRYAQFLAAADRVADDPKNAGMNTQIYTDYMEAYLQKVQQVNDKTKSDKPLDPRYVSHVIGRAENELAQEFAERYPRFAAEGASQEEKAIAAENQRAFQRLSTSLNGKGFFSYVYDEEKGGMQWGNVLAIPAFGLVAGLMGNFLGAAAGGGWLGMAITFGMALMGAAFGVQMVEYFSQPSQPATPNGASPERTTPEREHTQEQEVTGVTATHSAPAQPAQTAKPEYVFKTQKPPHEGQTQSMDVVQHNGELTRLARAGEKAQMRIDVRYSQRDRSFIISNVVLPSPSGNRTFGISKIGLVPDANGNIDLAAPQNVEALNELDRFVLAEIEKRKAYTLGNSPQATAKREALDAISKSEILRNSAAPVAEAVAGEKDMSPLESIRESLAYTRDNPEKVAGNIARNAMESPAGMVGIGLAGVRLMTTPISNAPFEMLNALGSIPRRPTPSNDRE